MKHTDLSSWVVQALSCAARAVSIPSRRRFAGSRPVAFPPEVLCEQFVCLDCCRRIRALSGLWETMASALSIISFAC